MTVARSIVLRALILSLVFLSPFQVSAEGSTGYYNDAAGQNAPMREVMSRSVDPSSGQVVEQKVAVPVSKDGWGNAAGPQYDLARDGAFDGQTVTVLHFYTGESFDFSLPKAALAQKGFSTYRFSGAAPSPSELEQALEKSSQLWIISGSSRLLGPEHLAVIQRFFEAGHGLYIWGDNEPYYADANYVAQALLGTSMHGNLQGNQTVKVAEAGANHGLLANHLLSTGLEYLYEGITIATIDAQPGLDPLFYGSAGNLVAAVYEREGKRAIIDGGFTRLYMHWDTAGTGRYVSNAAAWLANVERFSPES